MLLTNPSSSVTVNGGSGPGAAGFIVWAAGNDPKQNADAGSKRKCQERLSLLYALFFLFLFHSTGSDSPNLRVATTVQGSQSNEISTEYGAVPSDLSSTVGVPASGHVWMFPVAGA